MFEVDDIPYLDAREFDEFIAENVVHEEFLLFRRENEDDLDWILPTEPHYECYCTSCRERFYLPLSEGPLRGRNTCPRCKAKVSTRLWRQKSILAHTRFCFHFLRRGNGRSVWLSSCMVRLDTELDGSKYCAYEFARYVFWDGGSKKWTRDSAGNWREVRDRRLKHWVSAYGYYAQDCYAVYGTLEGSCLEYACLDEAFVQLEDIANYCAMYVRQPMLEYLWKMGLGGWLAERERGYTGLFSRVVNLRARSSEKFLRFGKAALRLVRKNRLSLREACEFRELLDLRAVDANADGVRFACALAGSGVQLGQLAQRTGATPRETARYIVRQAGDREIKAAAVELRDYLDQLERLNIDGEKLPRNLHEAHERLSKRERKLKHRDKLADFRARRHLYRWMRWEHDGMLIRPVDSPEEIVREGEITHNCVAGYAGRHAAGGTIILVLRQKTAPRTPWHTVEIDPETLECRQCYAAHNRRREPAAAEFMDLYLEHLKEVR